MIKFAKFAKKAGAKAVFMECIQSNMSKDMYKGINVANPKHPDHNKFVRILQNPIFREDFVSINKEFFNLKPKSLICSLFHNC